VADPAFAYTKKDALASYKKIHKAVAPKSWTVPREEKQTSLLKELCPETEILKFGEHQDLLFEVCHTLKIHHDHNKVLKHYREYLAHLDTKIAALDELPDPVPVTVSVREEKRLHDEAIQEGKKKQEYIAAPLPPPPKPQEIIRTEYVDPEYHELPKARSLLFHKLEQNDFTSILVLSINKFVRYPLQSLVLVHLKNDVSTNSLVLSFFAPSFIYLLLDAIYNILKIIQTVKILIKVNRRSRRQGSGPNRPSR
jgi:hypothetical protein